MNLFMQTLKYCSGLLAITYSIFSYSSTIEIPDTMIVVKVDNKAESLSFFSQKSSYELSEGKHVLILKYKELFEDENEDDHVTLRSEPFVVLFHTKKEHNYILTHTQNMSEKQARKFALQPKINIQTEQGDNVNVLTKNLVDFEAQAMLNAMSNQAHSLDNNQSQSQVKLVSEVNSVNKDKENSFIVNNLLHWWQLASEKEQQKFLSYIKNQGEQNETEGHNH